MDKNYTLIGVKKPVRDALKRLCVKNGTNYSFMIEKLIDCYNYTEERGL